MRPVKEVKDMRSQRSLVKRVAAYGGIMVFLVMALEVMIMISPFAFFFYSVFSPVFNFLGQHAATRWATSFFLPHMILPPTLFLKVVRIAGSVFFLVGFFAFVVCALQVYLGKIFKWGIAEKGIYRYIRHPQYLSLALWGAGMAILWPRFIVLVTLALMLILYYFLAKDEERRMLNQYGESYENYMKTTGRFFPRALERPFASLEKKMSPALTYLAVPVLIVTLVMGTGVLLRAVTLASLPYTVRDNLTLVPILPEDSQLDAKALSGILTGVHDAKVPFIASDKSYLGYVMPPDYIMQGMIADTGGHSHLYKQHHTVALITDWVLHPFAHLRRPPAAQMAAMHGVDPALARRHHCPLGIDQTNLQCNECPYRRVILVETDSPAGGRLAGSAALGVEVARTPVGFVDLNVQTGKIVKAARVATGTAWKDVPTPEI
jgi:protein-S-isoprenylcysteine O-methyltransferase Ste14